MAHAGGTECRAGPADSPEVAPWSGAVHTTRAPEFGTVRGAGLREAVQWDSARNSGHVPSGIRTRVLALKGPRPRPLDDGDARRELRIVPCVPTPSCTSGRNAWRDSSS